MRERLLQLLPEIGVPSVPSVPERKKPRKHCAFGDSANVTPSAGRGVTGVPVYGGLLHPVHSMQGKVYQEKTNKISVGTPVTPGTPHRDVAGEIIRQVFADYKDETKFEIPW